MPSLISIAAPQVDEFITSPKKLKAAAIRHSRNSRLWRRIQSTTLWLFLIVSFTLLTMIKSVVIWHPGNLLKNPCQTVRTIYGIHRRLITENLNLDLASHRRPQQQLPLMILPLKPHELPKNLSDSEREFWKQPNDLGYRPCLEISKEYAQASSAIIRQRRKYLMVVVNGGLNQQRNQIVDAVLIARILEAALVIPVLQVNQIWGDESEFSEIFDVEHFKRILRDDIRIVSSLPSTHVVARPAVESNMPLHASPDWIKSHYTRKLRRDGVLLLRGMDSRLSHDLPSDLQKLKCKAAFHALRFAPSLQALGEKLARRMWEEGPFVALHLRLEKDVWVRTGCLPGLSAELDEEIRIARIKSPQLLTSRSNMTFEERRKQGLCPLTAHEIARTLRALGANSRTRVFWAGGEAFGGSKSLEPLRAEFPLLYDKFSIAEPWEMEPFREKASSLAAIDYIITLNSDVFIPSHGGNMGHALRGHRAYVGHRKYITPQKRDLIQLFLNSSSMREEEINDEIKRLHSEANGRPQLRMEKPTRDVLGYPVPECMCRSSRTWHAVV
ncbi:O-fucosyltransferase 20 [Selaginella moellendorffii]|uniref:O-fucosyltransferase 20 n=1 Tax=Selaginella moellendorffii TaxID=88036 RepID=UPI000D1CB4CC|nr:O-fucosyltransferase 20 [Selaginella moellendorffii]|eukprot:XP_002991907.2 O-fucosyltransferase 20 [Selaginella moellendorffii]